MATRLRDLIRQYVGDGSPSEEFVSAQRIEDRFKERRDAINADGRLTTVGKREATDKLAGETRAAVDKWLDSSQRWSKDSLATSMNEIRKAVIPKRSDDPADRLEGAFRRSEIRRACEGWNSQEIEVLYRTADSSDVRAALEELPRIEKKSSGAVMVKPFIRDEVRAEVLIEAGKRALPDVAENIDRATSTISMYGTLAATLRQDIAAASPDAAKPVLVSRRAK